MLRAFVPFRRASSLTYSSVHVAEGAKEGHYEVSNNFFLKNISLVLNTVKWYFSTKGFDRSAETACAINGRCSSNPIAWYCWVGNTWSGLVRKKNAICQKFESTHFTWPKLCYMKHDTTNTKTKEEIVDHLLKVSILMFLRNNQLIILVFDYGLNPVSFALYDWRITRWKSRNRTQKYAGPAVGTNSGQLQTHSPQCVLFVYPEVVTRWTVSRNWITCRFEIIGTYARFSVLIF